jgi:biopolymer transport protein ExbD
MLRGRSAALGTKSLVWCHPLITVTNAAIFLMPDACDLWPPYRCGWNPFEIWRWMSFFQRLDVVALALLLAYVFVAFIYVNRRIRSIDGRATQNGGSALQRGSMSPAADLSVWVKTLKSIAHVAPFLGLAGACDGIFQAFTPIAVSWYTRVGAIAAIVSGALITTAAGLVVAIPAAWFYNHLQWRIGRLECEMHRARRGCFQFAQTLPLRKPFSRPPAFPLTAVPVLGFSALAFISLHSAFFLSKGLWVGLSPVGELKPAATSFSVRTEPMRIILRTAKDGPMTDVYVNSKKTAWDDLDTVLQNELSTKPQGLVYVGAQDGVSWMYVAEAIDMAEKLGCKVVLSTAVAGP